MPHALCFVRKQLPSYGKQCPCEPGYVHREKPSRAPSTLAVETTIAHNTIGTAAQPSRTADYDCPSSVPVENTVQSWPLPSIASRLPRHRDLQALSTCPSCQPSPALLE